MWEASFGELEGRASWQKTPGGVWNPVFLRKRSFCTWRAVDPGEQGRGESNGLIGRDDHRIEIVAPPAIFGPFGF